MANLPFSPYIMSLDLSLATAEILSPEAAPAEPLDRALRPTSLRDYIGQRQLKAQLTVYLSAANSRKEALDHTLLFGPPGLGKTTMAQIIANELGSRCLVTSGPMLEKPGDLAALLTQLGERDVLFIDEIHRLPLQVEEILYPAMEDYKLDIMVGEGAQVRSITLPLAPFTLVGATTRAGSLSAPLRDRFGISARMEYYDQEELTSILLRSANLLGMPASEDALANMAMRCRGTPRIANRMLRRVRDFATYSGDDEITLANSTEALAMLGVDFWGLDAVDRRYMQVLAQVYGGGPAGLEALAASTGDARETLEDAVEPYLLQQGLLQRTQRGRMLSSKGELYCLEELGIDPPPIVEGAKK